MSTIRDVAERAGVAPTTVSRVINSSGYVSAETRARVETAIAELHYVPNALARSLRSRKTRLLALVLTDITSPFWTTVARGVEDAASEHGFNVILGNTDESEDKQIDYVTVLLQKRVDGFLFVPGRSTPESVQLIQRQDVPVVVIDRQIPGVEVDVVRSDSEKGAYELIRHLLSLGHRRIGMLSGPETISTAVQRVAGYRRALAEAGVDATADLVRCGWYTQESGYQMTKQVLSAVPRPTALFAANCFIAIGALRALREAVLRVPEDAALVCFDDAPESATEPFLTIAAQPAYEVGRRATELLLARLSGEAPQECQEIVLPVEIVVRQSCGSAQPSLPRQL
ncbi:MAG: LacI family DNA-binding transcriptional regulator [Ardenticatenia bacterium]|nr:LacI family DNA-binding transcriptional regulator [Ardenticatenia bacterium]